jgi:hypothetical protein
VSWCRQWCVQHLLRLFRLIFSCSAQPIFVHSDVSINSKYRGYPALSAPAGNPDQDSHAYGESKGTQRAVFNFHGNPVERVVADFPSEFDCLVAKASCLVRCDAPTPLQSISKFAQDRDNGIANLITNGRRPNRRLPARIPPDSPKLILDGTKVVLDRGG